MTVVGSDYAYSIDAFVNAKNHIVSQIIKDL